MGDQSSSDYVLEDVTIVSSRFNDPAGLQVRGITVDYEVFEHIGKSYMTGRISLIDQMRLLDRVDIQGAEYVICGVRAPKDDSPVIVKRWIIDKIERTAKVNESNQVIFLHLIEDIAFLSNLQNVNKAYSGKPSDIIQKISNQFLDKNVNNQGEIEFQSPMKLIVPNLNPIEAMTWIKNRVTTTEGFPYFLFSTLGTESLLFTDLGTMLSQPPINTKSPFMYTQSASQGKDNNGPLSRYTIIEDYYHGNTENLFEMIRRGAIGARYSYYDTFEGQTSSFKFDIALDGISAAQEKNNKQSKFNFSTEFRFNDIPIQEYESRHVTQLSSSGAFNIGSSSLNSFEEEVDADSHRKKMIARSLRHFITKNPISIRVRGRDFIKDRGNYTLANSIRLAFLANKPIESKGAEVKIDPKLSGDYIIYSTKHSFKKEKYDLELLCVKISDLNRDTLVI